MEFIRAWWFFILVMSLIAFFIFRVGKYGGIKAGIFGARIKLKAGAIGGRSFPILSGSLRIYALDDPAERKVVGLEISAPFTAGTTGCLSLSKEEARLLVSVIQQAIVE